MLKVIYSNDTDTSCALFMDLPVGSVFECRTFTKPSMRYPNTYMKIATISDRSYKNALDLKTMLGVQIDLDKSVMEVKSATLTIEK